MSTVNSKDGLTGPKARKKYSDVELSDSVTAESQCLQDDETDALPESLHFGWFEALLIIVSITTYIVDIGFDIYAAYVYYETQYILYFVLTLVFIIIPAVTMTAFSLRWYIMDLDNQTSRPSCTKWIIRCIFLLLQMAPVLRYVDSFIYGWKSRKAAKSKDNGQQLKYYTLMIHEDADTALLRLFEAFMEAAPQVTLQLYILIYYSKDETAPFKNETQRNLLFVGILVSLVSIAWSLVAYNRYVRFSDAEKSNISIQGTVLQFFWHFCIISARVFAFSVFAATHPMLLFFVCLVHWLAMLVWLHIQSNYACENHCEEALHNFVVGFIYIFAFFNVKENERTRFKYLTFYIICFIENTILLASWFFSYTNVSTPEVFWFRVGGSLGDYLCFFVGVTCMIFYYRYHHPSLKFCSKKGNYKGDFPLDTSFSAIAPHVPKTKQETEKDVTPDPMTGNPHSGVSGKKNVTFAPDEPKLFHAAVTTAGTSNSTPNPNPNAETKL